MKILGWAGNAFLLAGAFLVGEKSPTAFLLVFAGEAIWTIKVARMQAVGHAVHLRRFRPPGPAELLALDPMNAEHSDQC